MSGRIGAVVLAAGQSRRMGRPKMLLPWGEHTVIGQVIRALSQAEDNLEIVVVAGEKEAEIRSALGLDSPVKVIYNPDYERGEMLSSLKVGLRGLPETVDAALVALGDQPQILPEVARKVIEAYRAVGARLAAPSYRMRRGHPWLVQRALWPEILRLPAEATLRDFLTLYGQEIRYVEVDTPTILKDLDTPQDYESEKPD